MIDAAAKPHRPPSLVRRLVLLALLWSAAVLIAAGAGLTWMFHQAAERRLDSDLTEVLDNLLSGTTVNENGELTAPPLTDPRALRAYSGRYWEIAVPDDAGGLRVVERSRSLFDTDLRAPKDGPGQLAERMGRVVHYNSEGPRREPVRVAAMQVRIPGFLRPVIFFVAENRRPIDEDSRNFALITFAAVGAMGVGLVIAVIIQVRVGLGPLFALRREVADVRTGKAERVEGVYPAELESLAAELNALVAHNQEVVERQRTHVGNLAHALKTPISVMLTESQQRPGPLADVVQRQAHSMQEQVDFHLRRARAAARAQGTGERTLVAPVVEELARTLERIFRDKGVAIEWDVPAPLCFNGERQDLMEMAGNAMENACKWAAKRVRVSGSALSARQLSLTIEDDGPGLPAEQREAVLRRGARLDESAPGSGLGLSIIDELAKAYGGSLSLGDARLGGLQLHIVLPRAEG